MQKFGMAREEWISLLVPLTDTDIEVTVTKYRSDHHKMRV